MTDILLNIAKIVKNKCKLYPVANAHHHMMICMYFICIYIDIYVCVFV